MEKHVRCPRCGKQNPTYRKTCEECGARLPATEEAFFPPVPEEEQERDTPMEPEPEPETFDTQRLLEDEALRRWLNEVLGEEFVDATPSSESPQPQTGLVDADFEEDERVSWEDVPPWAEQAEPQEAGETLPEEVTEDEPVEPAPPLPQEAKEPEPLEPSEHLQDLAQPKAISEPSPPFPATEDMEASPEAGMNVESLFQDIFIPESEEKEADVGEQPPWLVEETPVQEDKEITPAEDMPGPEEALPPWLTAEVTAEDEEMEEPVPTPFLPEQEEGEKPVSTTTDVQVQEPGQETSAEALSEEGAEGPMFGAMALDEQELASLLDKAAPPEKTDQETLEEDLAPGELPDWLSALRPEEDKAETETPVDEGEPAGPLAGIPDVLPVEARLVDMVQKEGRLALKLLVREEEQQWARWLQRWIRQEETHEDTHEEEVRVSKPMPYWLWRIVVGLLLLSALGLLLIFGPQGQVSSPSPSRGAQAFVTLVQTLPQRAVVFLAVDYHPAWAPEVNLSASTALKLLETKTPYYLVVTTQPYGLALAQKLLQEAGIPTERYTLLGYLPGDRIALALMARWPRTAFPPPLQGENPWNQAGLASWTGLESSALILVLTDQVTRARDWIEQLTPYLPSSTALAFAGSLQMVPVLEPYFDTQVRGWIGGWMDAAALASQTQVSIPLNVWTTWSVSWPLGLLLGVLSAATLAVVKRLRQGEES